MKKRTILIAKEKRQAETAVFQFMKKIEVHLYRQIFKIEMIVCLCTLSTDPEINLQCSRNKPTISGNMRLNCI